MRPIQHRTATRVLRAPPGVSIEECTPLAITDVTFPDGSHSVVSFWQPSPAELALLAAGKPVRLLAWGVTHPPVSVGVESDGEI